MRIIALPMVWTDDGTFRPLDRYASRADIQYAVGEVYRVAVEEERSIAAHRSYFAELHRLYDNLPEGQSHQFGNQEEFRKFCLIKTGHCTSRDVVCDSPKQAGVIAAFVGDMDEYCVVTVNDNVVSLFRARSQSVAAMKKEEFQRSVEDVLNYARAMVGVSATDSRREAAEGDA
jgi:hypothetical protein